VARTEHRAIFGCEQQAAGAHRHGHQAHFEAEGRVERDARVGGEAFVLDAPPGFKVGLVAVPVRAGCLLLTPENCTVLGACHVRARVLQQGLWSVAAHA